MAIPHFLPIVHRLFNQEADILERLGGHSQIPRLLAYVSQGQEFYLVQEFIDGHTLAAELPQGLRLDKSQVIQLLAEILEILAFVHDQGVIHRDIKPENLIRRRSDGKLVLIDFGAVKQVQFSETVRSAQINRTAPIGTPGYMPTEQATGNPHLSSDLYAVGIIGLQALTGIHPQKLQRDLGGELIWQDKAEAGPRLTEFLKRMTHPYFHRRYRTAREALLSLQQLGATHPRPNPHDASNSHHFADNALIPAAGLSPSLSAIWGVSGSCDLLIHVWLPSRIIPNSVFKRRNSSAADGDRHNCSMSLHNSLNTALMG